MIVNRPAFFKFSHGHRRCSENCLILMFMLCVYRTKFLVIFYGICQILWHMSEGKSQGNGQRYSFKTPGDSLPVAKYTDTFSALSSCNNYKYFCIICLFIAPVIQADGPAKIYPAQAHAQWKEVPILLPLMGRNTPSMETATMCWPRYCVQ